MARTPTTTHAVRLYVQGDDGQEHELGGELIVRSAAEGQRIELAILYPPITLSLPLSACWALYWATTDVVYPFPPQSTDAP